MKVFNKVKGGKGEYSAIKYLENNKYKIVETNYKNKVGEIDIIARQKDCLVFIEVKARQTKQYGLPSEAVDARKQRKIRLVAEGYLIKCKEIPQCRFDVIEILGDEINHIQNAF